MPTRAAAEHAEPPPVEQALLHALAGVVHAHVGVHAHSQPQPEHAAAPPAQEVKVRLSALCKSVL